MSEFYADRDPATVPVETQREREERSRLERLAKDDVAEHHPTGNVERQTGRLHALVMEAHERASRLEERLDPVRVTRPLPGEELGSDRPEGRCRLADSLADACVGLEHLVERLGRLYDEVDL